MIIIEYKYITINKLYKNQNIKKPSTAQSDVTDLNLCLQAKEHNGLNEQTTQHFSL